jgi:hypothetical protein
MGFKAKPPHPIATAVTAQRLVNFPAGIPASISLLMISLAYSVNESFLSEKNRGWKYVQEHILLGWQTPLRAY